MRLDLRRHATPTVLLLALAACGGPTPVSPSPLLNSGSGGSAISVGTGVNALIVIVPTPPTLPFDPASARLAQATATLTQIAGHPIRFEIDAALLPFWVGGFEEILTQSIENVARDLDELRRRQPAVFVESIPHLTTIACHYSALPSRDHPTLDGSGTFTLIRAREDATEVLRGEVGVALEDFVARLRKDRFGDISADRVAPQDREEYFAYYATTRGGYGYLREYLAEYGHPKPSPEDELARGPHAFTILHVSELALLLAASDDEFARKVRKWVLDEAYYLGGDYSYKLHADWIARMPADAPWKRAVGVWVRALDAHLARLDDPQRKKLASVLFPSRGACRNDQECVDVPTDFPGFDRFAFGMSALDAWRAGGYPLYTGGSRAMTFVDDIVCPYGRSAKGEWSSRTGGGAFYEQALATDATRRRFADELLRRDDPKLVEQAFVHAERVPSERVVAMLHLLDGHPKELAAALRVCREHLLRDLRGDDPLRRDLSRRGALSTPPASSKSEPVHASGFDEP